MPGIYMNCTLHTQLQLQLLAQCVVTCLFVNEKHLTSAVVESGSFPPNGELRGAEEIHSPHRRLR